MQEQTPTPGFKLKVLLTLAWPVVVARSSQAIIGFSDALMTAPLGEVELAAVTTGAMNTFTVIIFPMGLVFIGQSFAAQLVGKGQVAVAVRYAWYGLAIAAASGVLAIAAIPLVGPTLGLLDYEPAVLRLMTDYLDIRLLAVGAVVATEGLGNWYGGLGNTRLQMMAGLVAMVLNVPLNWILIHGHLGAPALGVRGAAMASAIATWAGLAVLVFAFARRIAVPASSTRPHKLRLSELGRMIRFGVPHGLNWFLEFAAFAIFINIVVAELGTVVLAAMMVVLSVNSVAFMPAFGVSSAGAILTGQAIGRGELGLVTRITLKTLAVTVSWQGAVGLVYLLAPEFLMSGFAASTAGSAELVKIGGVMLALSAAWQLFDAAAMTFGEALRSAGDTTWTLWARVVIAWLLFTPAAFVAVRFADGGHVAAMMCVIGYLGALAITLACRFASGAWKDIDMTGIEPAVG